MGKTSKIEKNFDCHACGFKTCRDMASAIALGLSARENCHQYMLQSIREERGKVATINQQVLTMNQVGTDMTVIESINHSIMEAMGHIENNIDSYRAMTGAVENVANKINLLSLNASIEAARAGDAGKGFAVVASNIQNLSQNSKQAVGSARENDEAIQQSMQEVTDVVTEFKSNIQELILVVKESSKEAQLTKDSSDSIQVSMEQLDDMATKVNGIIERINEILA